MLNLEKLIFVHVQIENFIFVLIFKFANWSFFGVLKSQGKQLISSKV